LNLDAAVSYPALLIASITFFFTFSAKVLEAKMDVIIKNNEINDNLTVKRFFDLHKRIHKQDKRHRQVRISLYSCVL
jgi:hypothetical protein